LAFLRNAAADARLVQADGLESKSAADVATCRADALDELHRLQRSLSSLDLDPTPDMTASRRCMSITTTRMLSVTVSV
jgi:hypothetical protein